MVKKCLITTGGTGGHLYPAQALARQLAERGCECLFVGGGLRENRFFDRSQFSYIDVPCALLSLKNPLSCWRMCRKIFQGMRQSRKVIQEFCPEIVVGFGSYYTFPTLLAAKLSSIPIVLHEANSIPGRVNRLLSKHSAVTAVHFSETASLLKGNVVEAGMPLRPNYRLGIVSKEEACQHFHLHPDIPVILLFGGSQGAFAINEVFLEAVTASLNQYSTAFQILQLTGSSDLAQKNQRDYERLGVPAYVKEFEKRMELAWAAADLVISRAGASTIAEQVEFEVPGILIPFPRAMDNHQEKNARWMVDHVGGALMYSEKELDPEKLAHGILHLLRDNQVALKAMRKNIHRYKKQAKRDNLCSLVWEVVDQERNYTHPS